MDIHTISTKKQISQTTNYRPLSFVDFIGQEDCKKVLQAAITSAHTQQKALWHILISGQSGYGKTTLSQIIAQHMQSNIKIITWYALSKPAEMISLLNSLGKNDILFIDEIHRLRPQVEEVLYIAMEDYRIDMIMPDGGMINIPLQAFTLIWATTQLEKLSTPLKNRFIYKFHFQDYNNQELAQIMKRYLEQNSITLSSWAVLGHIIQYLPHVPRDIATSCVQLKDYLIAYHDTQTLLTKDIREHFRTRSKRNKGWLTQLHQAYLHILQDANTSPVWLKTLAVKLWLSEKSVEDDIEPLLFKLGKIEKTSRGRILI